MREPLGRSTPVPAPVAFASFTDFSPDDACLIPMLKERKVEPLPDRTIRLAQRVDDGTGPEETNVVIRLRPPLGYDATLEGTSTTLRFDY